MESAAESATGRDEYANEDSAAQRIVVRACAGVPDESQLQSWLRQVVDRDEAAIDALYQALFGQVYGLALRITRRVQLAEEVAQDTFWQVWRQAPRFQPDRGSALAWIMTIARSRALDALRRTDTDECEAQSEWLEMIEAPGAETPHDLSDAMQQGHRLRAALDTLDPVARQLIALAFFRGLTHEEVAAYAGMPLGTVKTHIRRALAFLKRSLASGHDANDVNE